MFCLFVCLFFLHFFFILSRYAFVCNNWLALDRGDGKIIRNLKVAGQTDAANVNADFFRILRETLSDDNLWMSLLNRPTPSNFNRVQVCEYAIHFTSLDIVFISISSVLIKAPRFISFCFIFSFVLFYIRFLVFDIYFLVHLFLFFAYVCFVLFCRVTLKVFSRSL